MQHHLNDIPRGHSRRNRKTITDFLGSIPECRSVSENDENGAARSAGPCKNLISQLVFCRVIELEPCFAPCNFRDLLDTGSANSAENKWNVMFRCGLGQNLGGARPHEALKANGSDAEGCVISLTEELGAKIRSRVIPNIIGLQTDIADLLGVALQVDIGITTTLKIVKGEARHAAPGLGPKMFDGGVS